MAESKKETFQERQARFQERKENLAKQAETRIVYARTQDVRGLVGVISIADVALRRLRDGMGIRYSVETAAKKIEEFNQAAKDIVFVVADICKTTGIDFKPPRWAKAGSDVESDKNSVSVDDIPLDDNANENTLKPKITF